MITLALIFTMVLFVYHQLVLHFDFFPFNNIERTPFKMRMVDSLVSGAICLFTLLVLRLDESILIATAGSLLVLFFLKETRFVLNQKSFELQRVILLLLLILSLLFTLLTFLFN